MDSDVSLPTQENNEPKAEFRKITNEAANRKCRRSSPNSGSSDGDGSPTRDYSSRDISKASNHVRRSNDKMDDRSSSRSQHGRSSDSYRHSSRGNRHDEHSRYERHADEDDRSHDVSSRSGRESKGGSNADGRDQERDYNRSRDRCKDVDRYARDKSERTRYEERRGGRYDDRDRHSSDKYHHRDEKREYRSSRDHRGDRSVSYENPMGRQNDSNSKKETGDMKDVDGSKDGREKSEKELDTHKDRHGRVGGSSKDRSACVSEDSAAKRPKFSLGSNFRKGSEQDEDPMAKVSPAHVPVSDADIATSLDAAKVASMKAAQLGMNVGSADSGNNIGCSLEVDVLQNSPSLDPTQTPPAIPWSRPERIKVNDDTSLLLVPRIKLNFILGCTKGFIGRLLVESTVKHIVTNSFRNPCLFPNKPLIIPENDVHFRYVSEPKWTDEDNMFVVAEGCLFVRNAKLQDKKALVFGRDFLLQKMSAYKYNFYDACYELRLSLPPGEDADKMMASILKTQIDNTGPSQELPTIMMKGLPLQWFAEQPDSSKPSKPLLLYFFKSFGSVRNLDVVDDGVFIQFENCYKALQLLCSCSLQKVGSNEMADYTIMWKDQGVCFDASQEASSVSKCFRFDKALNGRLFVSPPRKKVLKQKANALEFHVSKLEEELKAIMGAFKTRVREFVEELNHLPDII